MLITDNFIASLGGKILLYMNLKTTFQLASYSYLDGIMYITSCWRKFIVGNCKFVLDIFIVQVNSLFNWVLKLFFFVQNHVMIIVLFLMYLLKQPSRLGNYDLNNFYNNVLNTITLNSLNHYLCCNFISLYLKRPKSKSKHQ